MAEPSKPEKEPKRASIRRDSRPDARSRRDVLRRRRTAAKKRTKSRLPRKP